MTFSDALIYSLLGICVVFFALILLMCIIKLMTALGDWEDKKKAVASAEAAPAAASAPTVQPSSGCPREVKIYDTDPRAAAMMMAIVADTTKIPLNKLRFISIREIKEEDEK